MTIELKSNTLKAKIQSKGAELISLIDKDNIEYMWQKDAKYWNRSSPILFPIVGNLRDNKIIIEGSEYTISKHGFCRDADFVVDEQGDNFVKLSYSFNEETLKMYPYKFKLSLAYTINEEDIQIVYTVENLDDKAINYCFGAHPAFNIPVNGEGEFEDYCLEFNKSEPDGCPIYNLEKLHIDVDNRIHLLDENNKIMLKYNLFDEDAITFDKVKSDVVKLYNVKTNKGVEVCFADFDSIAFWTPTKQEAPFLCIEPWNGMAVRSDENNQYKDKFSVRSLEIGNHDNYKLTIRVL